MPLIRRTFPVGALGCNCTIVACPDTRQALVIDPGDDAADILADLARDGLTAVKLLHTHAHFDHVMGTADVAAATGAEVLLHRDDRWLYDRTLMQIEMFGIRRSDGQPWHPPPEPTRELTGDEVLTFGRREARAVHTPGHTPGSTCFYVEGASETPLLLAGDTLFKQSIGRTDLWGGSLETIRQSIRERLFALPDDTLVIPGHGPPTTIAAERESNPFLR
ncbi:MAG TPA: MBL fold metallo-hydrolase [Polyangia bacterium]|nr:MBL fold metallo-hydrolase [Polyangia bacterium]